MNYELQYANRPEHLFVGPRRCGKSRIVAELHEAGYWAHEHTTESGDEIARIYAAQRKLYEADLSAKLQPRIFFSDSAWWLYSARFYYVDPHFKAEISFPERELSMLLPERDVDWFYRWGSDARERLIPELAISISDNEVAAGSLYMSARQQSAAFIERVYPELVPVLVWAIPHMPRFLPQNSPLRMPRAAFESRVRSFRQKFELPHKLTAQNLTEYLIALGILEYTHTYYLRFAPAYAAGLCELKNNLTHEAITARMKGTTP